LEKLLIGYKRNGLDLPEEAKRRFGEIDKRLSEICTTFKKNLNDETTKKSFPRE
jgi:Zn-dependent oligopeptidase